MKSHPATPSVKDMAQSHCNCSDGKSISVMWVAATRGAGWLIQTSSKTYGNRPRVAEPMQTWGAGRRVADLVAEKNVSLYLFEGGLSSIER